MKKNECSFCGAKASIVTLLIIGKNACICSDCVRICLVRIINEARWSYPIDIKVTRKGEKARKAIEAKRRGKT